VRGQGADRRGGIGYSRAASEMRIGRKRKRGLQTVREGRALNGLGCVKGGEWGERTRWEFPLTQQKVPGATYDLSANQGPSKWEKQRVALLDESTERPAQEWNAAGEKNG